MIELSNMNIGKALILIYVCAFAGFGLFSRFLLKKLEICFRLNKCLLIGKEGIIFICLYMLPLCRKEKKPQTNTK